MKIIQSVFGSKSEREIKRMMPVIREINDLEPALQALTDEQLQAKTVEFKERVEKARAEGVADDEILDGLLPEAFAVAREASRRAVNMRPFDVQLIGGMILHRGKIAEMKTGEGKTLVATMPAYLNALLGKGVHVVTVNEYLAARDSEWMGRIYQFLGMTVGCLDSTEAGTPERKQQYLCDITYGTNNEFGFDYLRDNMATNKEHCVQREYNFAIVDEVDNILIDEARTPHIISGPVEQTSDKYLRVNAIVPKLKKGEVIKGGRPDVPDRYTGDYTVDEKSHTATLTEEGVFHCEKLLGLSNLYEDVNSEWVHHITQAIRAHSLFHLDTDYVIKDGEVIIVDEFTGRLQPGRRWSDGLHQAIEAKENVRVARENQTLATVTLQNYFRMYEKLAGMTGTAETEATEFAQIYNLDVTVIPTNKSMVRNDFADEVYRTEREKFTAVVQEIRTMNEKGRPVLVGTCSIEKSEHLSNLLKREGIKHNVLNAKQHAREAEFIAQAGRINAVTIATNMAGRGTDILLGGNAEFLARQELKKKNEDAEINLEELPAQIEKIKPVVEAEHNKVVELGGLHIVGTERHESRRIDNQLRGRAGRQGDPGSSKFFLSLDDKLMRIFGGERIQSLMERFGAQEGDVISHPLVNRSIANAQNRVERHNFEIRKHLLEYDDVMNQQREAVYGLRRQILEGQSVKDEILDRVEETVAAKVSTYCSDETYADEWNFAALNSEVRRAFGLDWNLSIEKLNGRKVEDLTQDLVDTVEKNYLEKEQRLTPEVMRQMERNIMLYVIDNRWKDHLLAMDELKESIHLRGYGQKDPLVEYKHEAFKMFNEMMQRVGEEVTEFVFRTEAINERKSEQKKLDFVHSEVSAFNKDELTTNAPEKEVRKKEPVHAGPKVGRNDPCPCGSGKKYKKCCGVNEQ